MGQVEYISISEIFWDFIASFFGIFVSDRNNPN